MYSLLHDDIYSLLVAAPALVGDQLTEVVAVIAAPKVIRAVEISEKVKQHEKFKRVQYLRE